MWKSATTNDPSGYRYQLDELAAFIPGLGYLLDASSDGPMRDCLIEPALSSMERDEFVFASAGLLRAMLTDLPIPPEGHPGYQLALVAEFLSETHAMIESELTDGDDDGCRKLAWTSIERLLPRQPGKQGSTPWAFEGLKLDSTRPHLSPSLTSKVWARLLLQDGGLWSEFLVDQDWRITEILDAPYDQANQIADLMGIDLGSTHALPPTPSPAQLKESERYLREIIDKFDAAPQPPPDSSDFPF